MDKPAFKYTGREDDGTGLYYYRARYYSPEMRRFVSEDPIGLKGGDVNLYGYVANDPVNRIDPTGNVAVAIPIILGGIRVGGMILPRLAPYLPRLGPIFFLPPVQPQQCKDDDDKCEKQYYEVDIPTCRGISRSRGAAAATRCYASAAERYAACLAGRPMPPLDTYNN